jgi:hypothetical protein
MLWYEWLVLGRCLTGTKLKDWRICTAKLDQIDREYVLEVEKMMSETSTGNQALRGSCGYNRSHSRYRPRRHLSQGILIQLKNTLCDEKELHDSQIYYLHHQVAPLNP